MKTQNVATKSSNRTRQPQAPDKPTARPVLPRTRHNVSSGHAPPVLPSPRPPHFEGDSPEHNDEHLTPTSQTLRDNDPLVPTTTGKSKWTAGELWSLTLAVHDKQPYIAKHTEKAGRWDEIRDVIGEAGYCERSTKSYQLQMKRLLSWQQGSKVLRFFCWLNTTDQPTGLE